MSSVAFLTSRGSFSSVATSCTTRSAASRSSSTTSRTHRRRSSGGGTSNGKSVTITGMANPPSPVAMTRQLEASRSLTTVPPPASNPNITCSTTGTATGSSASSSSTNGLLGLTVTAAGAGACLLMGMSHEGQKHRSQHFCKAHANLDGEDETEEFWGDESSRNGNMSGGPLASSHYGKNLISDLPSPFLQWLQRLGEKQEEEKSNEEDTKTFVHPYLPLPFSLTGDGTPGSGVLDLRVRQTVGNSKEVARGAGMEASKGRKDTFDVSVRALKGNRLAMEDEYCIRNGGRFAAVFDGHGGGDVSTYLRNQLYDLIESHLEKTSNMNNSSSLDTTISSIRTAFDEIDCQVLKTDKLQYQGSTAVAVYLHRDDVTGRQTLISANVGDSRAIFSKSGVAVDLTRDHKPDDKMERKRIMDMGEKIEWDDYSGVFRVRNLSLSRAIGDRFAKPVVSGEVEIKVFPLEEETKVGTNPTNDFVVLASDGLWDVMTSQDCVDFVHKRLSPSSAQLKNMSSIEVQRQLHIRKKNMSRFLGNEALRRGSGDNVCIIIVWLNS